MADVTDEQWIRLEPFGQNLSLQPKVDPSPEATGKCLTALSGSGQLVPDGTTSLIDIHQLALTGQDYSHGKTKVFSSKYSRKFLSELEQQGQLDWGKTLAKGRKAKGGKGRWWWSMAKQSPSVLTLIQPRRVK